MFVEVLGWQKYNPRKDLRAPSWFRLQHDFWLSQKFFKFDCDGKMVWIAILSEAAKKQRAIIEIDTELVSAILKIPEDKVKKIIEKLAALDDTLRIRDEGVTPPIPMRTTTRRDETRRDETRRNIKTPNGVMDGEPPPTKPPPNKYGPYIDAYNAFAELANIPKVMTLTEARRKKLASRIKEGLTLDRLKEVFAEAAKQPFLFGDSKGGWKMNFDWLVANAENCLKVLEGKYIKSGLGNMGEAERALQRLYHDIDNDNL